MEDSDVRAAARAHGGRAGGSDFDPACAETPEFLIAGAAVDERAEAAELHRLVERATEQEVLAKLVSRHEGRCMPVPPPVPSVSGRDVQRFAQALTGPSQDRAATVADALGDQGVPVERLLLDLFAGAAEQIDQWWEEDRCADHERAIAQARLGVLARRHASGLDLEPVRARGSAPDRGPAVIGLIDGDRRMLDATLTELFLGAGGFDVACLPALGASLPRAVVTARRRARVIVLLVERDTLLAPLGALIAAIRDQYRGAAPPILVSGPLLRWHPEKVTALGADAHAWDARDVYRQALTLDG